MIASHQLGIEKSFDAVLVGAGIMSTTLAVLLSELDPDLKLLIVERLEGPGLESSAAVNNAGTGHAANCELNYTPLQADGTLSISKALSINAAFERSLEFWASLVEQGKLIPQRFLHKLPHISFVWGDEDVAFLRKRFLKLADLTAFAEMKWSDEYEQLHSWMPLVMEGRPKSGSYAATIVERGTDIDFGSLTSCFVERLNEVDCVELIFGSKVVDLKKVDNDFWQLDILSSNGKYQVKTDFVFLGAGGGALTLLQKSGIPESRIYGGFPVSGQWLVCSDPSLATQHSAKVYGKAKVGAPPMSVPHLDTRWIEGSRSLLFGPYAGFSGKFLKEGSRLDLLQSISRSNLLPMLQVGFNNIELVTYLIGQLLQGEEERMDALYAFFPFADPKDWDVAIAGQRVQIIKRTSSGGVLQMGTEVVTSSDGSLAALLGASPGASTSVSIMLEILQRCWTKQMTSSPWRERLVNLLPSFNDGLAPAGKTLVEMRRRSNFLLDLQ